MPIEYISKQEAEKLSEIKLDGRRKYFIWDGLVCTGEKFTIACSGCSGEDPYVDEYRGDGCFECGYTGRRRSSFPCPVNHKQIG